MDLGEALYRMITGGRSSASEGFTTPGGLRRALAELDKATHGKRQAEADLLGFSVRAVRRWREGLRADPPRLPDPRKQQGKDMRGHVLLAQRAVRLTAKRRARLVAPGAVPTVHTKPFWKSGDERDRNLKFTEHLLVAGTLAAVVAAYDRGDPPDQLAAVFLAGIQNDDGVYRDGLSNLVPGTGANITHISIE